MKLSPALNRYLGRSYLINLIFMVGILWGVIYLFDTVELLRRATKEGGISLPLVMKMGLFKLPDTGLTVFSFAILFSAMYTFWRLNRRHEIVILRAAGLSVWQFMMPVIFVAMATGLLIITIANPFSAILLARYKALESEYLTHHNNEVALFDEGIWLRQGLEGDKYLILHAGHIIMPGWELQDANILYFGKNDSFIKRVDAPSGKLASGVWLFNDAAINVPGRKTQITPLFRLPTDPTAGDIEDSLSSPETMSLWHLPAFIHTVESTGFDATRLRIHLQSLLAQPFLYAAMILLAAAVSLHPPRFRGTLVLVITGLLMGFATFLISGFLRALGASHQIPVPLAAWAPAFVLFMLGAAVMLGTEEG